MHGRWAITLKALRTASAVLRIIITWSAFLAAGAIYILAYSRSSWTAMLVAGVAFGIATFGVADAFPIADSDDN